MTSHLTTVESWCGYSARQGTSAMPVCASRPASRMRDDRLGTADNAGQIDAFALYCPRIQRVYLVPIEAVKTTIGARLRLEPAKNGQTWNGKWARDFELARR